MFGTQGARSPIVELAAVAVIIFALAAIGIMTGLIPSSYPRSGPPVSRICPDCGVVESIRLIEPEGQGSGAVAGGIPGAVAGDETGAGYDKTPATSVGVPGGTHAGSELESNMKKLLQYRVSLRMNDGSIRTITRDTDPGVHVGDSMKLVDGAVNMK